MTVVGPRGNELKWKEPQDPTRMVYWEHESMYGHPVKGSLRTISHLDWMSSRAEKIFGQRIVVIQTAYNTTVPASKGTHDGDACMDFSMIVMGNDALLTDVNIKQIKGGPKSAVVDASFRNLGKATTVTYDLLRDKQGWMIDEMRSGCYVLSEALQQKSKC